MQAQTQVGRELMSQANQLGAQLSAQKLAYEVPWAQQQQTWKREDLLRKYMMGQQDWQDIMQGMTGAFGMWAQSGAMNPYMELMRRIESFGDTTSPARRR